MSSRHRVLTFISLVILPLILFQFQNCAPAGAGATAPGQVGLVDNIKTQIQFVNNNAQIQDEAASVDIDGFCSSDHEGATLTWSVWDPQNSKQPILQGTTACAHGRFDVSLTQLDQYVCGLEHILVVQGDWGASSESQFVRRCQPLASQPQDPPAGSPYGTSCDIEYSPVGDADQQCASVCYRSNQVVLVQSLDVSQCSSLAAGLAGR